MEYDASFLPAVLGGAVRLRNYLGGASRRLTSQTNIGRFRVLSAIDEKMRARGPRETSDHRGSPRIEHAINKVP